MSITTKEEKTVKQGALVLRAINHPLRKQIYNHLVQNPKQPVNVLYKHFRIEQTVASQMLGILREAGFVTTERQGKFVLYSANTERLSQVLAQCQILNNQN